MNLRPFKSERMDRRCVCGCTFGCLVVAVVACDVRRTTSRARLVLSPPLPVQPNVAQRSELARQHSE